MNLREKIFESVKSYNLNVGYVWAFGQYSNVWRNAKPPIKAPEFFNEMENLIKEGLFERGRQIQSNDSYKLTQKGFDIIWGNE
jgi:hypothetical protein